MTREKGKPGREVLFEIVPMGGTVKVIAIDAASGKEVVIQGPASAGAEVLKQSAMRKLIYVLTKDKKAK